MGTVEVALAACAALDDALNKVGRQAGGVSPGNGERASLDALRAATEGVRGHVSKMALLWKSTDNVSAKDTESLTKGLQMRVVDACECCQRFTVGGGPSLQKAVTKFASALVGSCTVFLNGILVDAIKGEAVVKLVQPVIAACDAASAVPVDNRTALSRSLTQVARSVEDAARDGRELAQQATKAAEEAENAAQPGEESDDDVGWPPLCPEEMAVALMTAAALEAVEKLLRSSIQMLLKGPEPSGELLDEWESIATFHGPQLDRAAVDLGAGLYPPISPADVRGDAEALLNCVELIMDEMPVERLGDKPDADLIEGGLLRNDMGAVFAALLQSIDCLPEQVSAVKVAKPAAD